MSNRLMQSTALRGLVFANANGRGIPRAVSAGRDHVESFRELVGRVAIQMNADGPANAPPRTTGGNDRRGANAAIAELEGQVEGLRAAVDELSAGSQMARLGRPANAEDAIDREYSDLFAGWFRGHGDEHALRAANMDGQRGQLRASLSTGSAGDGGYLAPIEWDRTISKKLIPLSPMRRVSSVIETKVRAFSTLWNGGGWGTGWVGETASRPATTTATLAPITFTSGELYAMPIATQQLLDDSELNVADWLASEIADTFAAQENIAFVAGDGVNKPNGFLTFVTGGSNAAAHPAGAIALYPSGQASTIGAGSTASDMLTDFVYSLKTPYRGPNTKWMMNSLTAATVMKLKDGQNNYLWRETYVAGQPATLLGFEVVINEDMPDIAAGNMPIAFGDFQRGYLVNDRFGVRVLRDPYTNKPFVNFYTTKRVGGGVRDPNAIKVLKIAAA